MAPHLRTLHVAENAGIMLRERHALHCIDEVALAAFAKPRDQKITTRDVQTTKKVLTTDVSRCFVHKTIAMRPR